ncbi:hypothetical protein N0V90_001599 [Kalmusia sp. IMI 367209]|nr:hypothetical protein N0V90_001599 [Kalmusia sp. IMI 367209]
MSSSRYPDSRYVRERSPFRDRRPSTYGSTYPPRPNDAGPRSNADASGFPPRDTPRGPKSLVDGPRGPPAGAPSGAPSAPRDGRGRGFAGQTVTGTLIATDEIGDHPPDDRQFEIHETIAINEISLAISTLIVPDAIRATGHLRQDQHIQILRSALAHHIEEVGLVAVGEDGIFRLKDEDVADRLMRTTETDIMIHETACPIGPTVHAVVQGIQCDGTEIRGMSVTGTLIGENVKIGDTRQESTTLILDQQVLNQGRVRLIHTVGARRLIRDMLLVPLQERRHIRHTIHPLIDMDRLWIPTRDVLQSQQNPQVVKMEGGKPDETIFC